MALISLFFQTKAKLDMLELDASISESHEATAQLSQSEVEDGSSVTDNVTLLPIKLTLEGVVSKTPLGFAGLIGSGVTAVAGAVGGALGGSGTAAGAIATTGIASLGGLVASAVGASGPNSREPADVWDYLLELRNRRIPFDVVTALKLYESMVLTSVSVPRSIQTVGVLRFQATLEQVKIVKASTIDLGSLSSLGGAAAAASNLGKQAATGASSTTSSSAASWLSQLTGIGA